VEQRIAFNGHRYLKIIETVVKINAGCVNGFKQNNLLVWSRF
jgi:hypothetical protein